MGYRTTIVLDKESRAAARAAARRLGCSTSEAIRRAIRRFSDTEIALPAEAVARRRVLLDRWIRLSTGSNPGEEVERLKAEDEGF